MVINKNINQTTKENQRQNYDKAKKSIRFNQEIGQPLAREATVYN